MAPKLKNNKELGKPWHEESNLVFRSREELIVVGKYVNSQIQLLSEEDVETCKELKFKYDSTCVKTDDESEKEEDNVDEQESVEEEPKVTIATNTVQNVSLFDGAMTTLQNVYREVTSERDSLKLDNESLQKELASLKAKFAKLRESLDF